MDAGVNCAVAVVSPSVSSAIAPDAFVLPNVLLRNAKRMLDRYSVPFERIERLKNVWVCFSRESAKVASVWSNVTGFSATGTGHYGVLSSSADLAERAFSALSRAPRLGETIEIDADIDGHGLSSGELAAWLSNRFREKFPQSDVRLLDATMKIGVRVSGNRVLVYSLSHAAPGGWPVGSRAPRGVFLFGHGREGDLVRALLSRGHEVVGFVDAVSPSAEWLAPFADYHLGQAPRVHALADFSRLARVLERPVLACSIDAFDASALIRAKDRAARANAELEFPLLLRARPAAGGARVALVLESSFSRDGVGR